MSTQQRKSLTGDHLREFRGGNPPPNDRANSPSHSSQHTELREDGWREPNGSQGRDETRANAEHAEDVALSSSRLGGQPGERTWWRPFEDMVIRDEGKCAY